jgi:hypothetical protein
MDEWSSWKVPEAFVLSTIKPTILSQFQCFHCFLHVIGSYVSEGYVVYGCDQSLDSIGRPVIFLLAFASTVIPVSSLTNINDQDFYSLLDMDRFEMRPPLQRSMGWFFYIGVTFVET